MYKQEQVSTRKRRTASKYKMDTDLVFFRKNQF